MKINYPLPGDTAALRQLWATVFADTDTFLEMIGFSQADIRRIKAQENRVRGLTFLQEIGEE